MRENQSGDHLDQIHDAATTLAAMGIAVSEPDDCVDTSNGWATIGTLVQVDTFVEVIPRIGLVAAQMARLLTVAAQVWMVGRGYLDDWAYWPGLGWATDVYMRQPDESGFLRAASLLSRSTVGGDILVFSGLSEPSAR